ncbi:MAG: Hpt domain-containing protein [Flavobacteriales bacterium]
MSNYLDLSYIMDNVSDDPGFIKQLLSVFLENLEPDYEVLREVTVAGDHEHIKRTAHRMKSSFRSLGMSTLADLTQTIEKSAHAKEELQSIRSMVDELGSQVPMAVGEVELYLNS